jgi:hypothetical protein
MKHEKIKLKKCRDYIKEKMQRPIEASKEFNNSTKHKIIFRQEVCPFPVETDRISCNVYSILRIYRSRPQISSGASPKFQNERIEFAEFNFGKEITGKMNELRGSQSIYFKSSKSLSQLRILRPYFDAAICRIVKIS